jgi:hypothetical protein
MNERIRELYYECQDESQSTEQCYQKFAELIVKECAEMGDNFDGQPVGNAVREYLTAGDAIREYFGVEE